VWPGVVRFEHRLGPVMETRAKVIATGVAVAWAKLRNCSSGGSNKRREHSSDSTRSEPEVGGRSQTWTATRKPRSSTPGM
jgi:hypothetical protein